MNTFELKTKVIFGREALQYLQNLVQKKIFIVTDPYMVKSGMIDSITKYLAEGSFQIFSDIVPDPPMELVVKGVGEVIAYQPDAMVAVGGGSAIDSAKAIMHFSREIGELEKMQFIAVPTTSGTGSEVTSFAVITDKQKGVKYPLVSDVLIPDVALLEPELVKTVPPAIVADTGMDVLTHALEAYVSTKATDFSDALAEKAVALVFQYLLRSYESSEDMEAKEKMHNASCLAGISFNLASLGLNHAIAHNIGGKLHVPHGRTNAILLPHVIEFNSNITGFTPKDYSEAAIKYAKIAKLIGVTGSTVRLSVKNLINEITKLMQRMKMPTKLTECKISTEDILKEKKSIAEGALKDACILTNPRVAGISDVSEIIHKIS
ncbi:1-propanol dehydrogenase PduQ [Anaerocolumna aminovalerica]|jgi:1-propanol dehydrogenase|uniref:Alcohol dehydrogenase, class IV n=1 Tax=Anaerocolumna aminovalerica TaxID=1527 RepID=A0A1I5IEU2_9FIRM|nr:1-propanol dehydrogenase PduQ [Anaerocolumna aminovalerica]MBU5331574.1 iron-containing alcohol dehydrogenase [Anaerocolumna aminovalerica]SFO58889.1 Alcohol dehydrogenase, class IV [Anaerocolumna aminovalerica]